jgi:hypothetical protein
MNSPADTILGAASSLSDAELRSVVARMRAMCARRSIAMSADALSSESSEEEHPAYDNPADTMLRDASALSNAELRSVVARLNHLMGT